MIQRKYYCSQKIRFIIRYNKNLSKYCVIYLLYIYNYKAAYASERDRNYFIARFQLSL